MGPLLMIGLLIACGEKNAPSENAPEDEPTLEEPEPPEAPTAWDYSGDSELPVYDQEALEQTLNAAIRDAMTVNGAPALDAYLDLMEQAGELCPTWYDYEEADYWSDNCYADSGVGFSGYIFTQDYVDSELLGEGSSLSGMVLNGQAKILDTSGYQLDLSGTTYDAYGTVDNGDTEAWMTGVVGTFAWDAPGSESSWLSESLQPTLKTVAYRYLLGDGTSAQVLSIAGGISGLDAPWSTAYLGDVYTADEVIGFWECGLEPLGTMSARSSDGHWYQLSFDVTNSGGVYQAPAGLCDGCGSVTRAGEEVGEACIDVSPFTSWEDQPW
jgi:hypothetical protein